MRFFNDALILGDGQLFHYVVETSTGQLVQPKQITLGTRQIHLTSFQANTSKQPMVLASSDRPCLIHYDGKKLCFSPINLKHVDRMCSFQSSVYRGAMLIVNQQGFIIGTVDDIQKLHVRKIPLGEQARRICYDENSGTFGIITIKDQASDPNFDFEQYFFRVLDAQTFEGEFVVDDDVF